MISMCIDSKVRNNEQNMPYLASLSKKQKKYFYSKRRTLSKF